MLLCVVRLSMAVLLSCCQVADDSVAVHCQVVDGSVAVELLMAVLLPVADDDVTVSCQVAVRDVAVRWWMTMLLMAVLLSSC